MIPQAVLAVLLASPPGKYQTTVQGPRPTPAPGRAATRVTRADLDERQPRSAPDALRWEPGVYVQQTSTGQGSAFVRGRTGQQTVLLYDGIRLNNSLYRQGPNQYFFTVDMRSVDSVTVTRGGASTRWGSDAIGGALDARPVEPAPGDFAVRPRGQWRGATADQELGGRAQLDARLATGLELALGVGARRVGRLEGGGAVRSPETGEPALVPRLDDDGRTQLGTGFDEIASDARLAWRASPRARVTAAVYDYRQLDAPRTDQCPPAYAPRDECLRYEEQFHTLGYLALDAELGRAAKKLRATLSFQRQHERRLRERPSSFVENGGRDDVNTLGASLHAESAARVLGRVEGARLRWGGDLYHDRVASRAWTTFTDIDVTHYASRGQYLDGSRYTTGGGFVEGEGTLCRRITLRAGGRAGFSAAHAPGDPASATSAIDQAWLALAGHAGVEWQATPRVALLATVDRSFRAPNLDDLTSRQATGPGFQFENAGLLPETSLSVEAGARVEAGPVRAEAWAYASRLDDAIARAQRDVDDCPASAPECASSWYRYQLINLDGPAWILGVEGAARVRLPRGFEARATVAWARGDGPNPQEPPADPSLPYDETVPLSRIPPLNGTAELGWRARGFRLGAGLRWATLADRLAPSDRGDPRIPAGGTPGYAVLDVRAGYRLGRRLAAHVVVENVTDAAYRYHGSSVNGPGRGIVVSLEAGL